VGTSVTIEVSSTFQPITDDRLWVRTYGPRVPDKLFRPPVGNGPSAWRRARLTVGTTILPAMAP